VPHADECQRLARPRDPNGPQSFRYVSLEGALSSDRGMRLSAAESATIKKEAANAAAFFTYHRSW
jgi:hypothetical protein